MTVHITSSKSECHQPFKKNYYFFSHNPKLGPPTSPDFQNFDILCFKKTLSSSGPRMNTEVTLKKKEFQTIIDKVWNEINILAVP